VSQQEEGQNPIKFQDSRWAIVFQSSPYQIKDKHV
jgi:hypothetical protein